MGYSFRLAASFLLYASPKDRIAHITAVVSKVVEHWLERDLKGGGTYCKDDSNYQKGNPLLLLHGLFFPVSNMGSFICNISHIG